MSGPTSEGPAPSTANAAVVGALAGLAVGALTSPLQGWLDDSVSSLANSAGSWSLIAFMVARRARSVGVGAVVGVLTLAMCEVGYVVATEIRGGATASSTAMFWLAAAVLAGPPLGVAAVWSSRQDVVRRGAGFGVMSGVLLGEGIYGLDRVSETTDARYWTAEVVVGVAIVVWVVLRYRSMVSSASCIAATAGAAAVVYLVAISA